MRSLTTSCLSFTLILVHSLAASAADPQPATAPGAPNPAAQTLVVFPFNVSAGAKSPWVGKAVQQNVFTDLIQRTRSRVEAVQGDPADGMADALRRARAANAQLAVFGDVQSAANNIRITGQVVDVPSGNVLGGLKATGPENDLFPLEDSIAAQVLRALPPALVLAPPIQQQQPVQQMQPQVQYSPQPQYVQPPVTQYYPDPSPSYTTYNYYDSYTSSPYDYGYPYYGYPFFGAGVFVDIDGFHHRGFDRGGFNRGGFNRGGFKRGGINIDHGFRRGFAGGSFGRTGFSGFNTFGRSSFGGFRGSAGGSFRGGGGRGR